MQLIRGSLIVHGLVVWSEETRCGLKFSGRIDVDQWRAAQSNAEQERVDEVVRLVKAGVVPLPVPPLDGQDEDPSGDQSLSGDLSRASELLKNLGEALAGDADVVGRHGGVLQNLDIAMQVIAAVNAALSDECDADGAHLSGLRRSADQAIRTGH